MNEQYVCLTNASLYLDPRSHRIVYHELSRSVWNKTRCGRVRYSDTAPTIQAEFARKMETLHREIARRFAEPCKKCGK